MISAPLRTVNKNFALFLFFCFSGAKVFSPAFIFEPIRCRFIDILYPNSILIPSFVICRASALLCCLPVFLVTLACRSPLKRLPLLPYPFIFASFSIASHPRLSSHSQLPTFSIAFLPRLLFPKLFFFIPPLITYHFSFQLPPLFNASPRFLHASYPSQQI